MTRFLTKEQVNCRIVLSPGQNTDSFVLWAIGLIHKAKIKIDNIAVPMTASGLQGE